MPEGYGGPAMAPGRHGHDAMVQAGVILCGLAGFVVGYPLFRVGTGATAASTAFARQPSFQVWALLVGAGTAYSGLVLLPLCQWHGDLRETAGCPSEGWSGALAAVWALSLAVPLALQAFLKPHLLHSPLSGDLWRQAALGLVDLVVMVPAILDLQLVQGAARSPVAELTCTSEAGLLSRYLSLQGRLRAVLAVMGGLATVVVLEFGARINALDAFDPTLPVPRELLYIVSSLLAAGVAVLYLPAFSVLQRAGEELVDHLCPMVPVADADFLEVVEKRTTLRSMLSLDTTARSNLESGVLILTPLLGGVASTFVSGK